MPTGKDLDAVAPKNPVALWRCDLHLAVVNSAALKSAGIDEQTPDPPEGVIERDTAGRPNGILREHALNLVSAAIPKPGDEENRQALREGIPVLHSWGLTGINDIYLMGGHDGAPALRAWQRLRDEGELSLRCWSSIPGEHLEEAIALGVRTGLGDDRLRLGHVKFFADGGMGARTAWMLEPYLDAGSGMPLADMAELEKAVRLADRAGLAVMIHAIGDRANRELIGIFERLLRLRSREPAEAASPPPVPHRIEHVQMIRPEDISRLARLNLVAGVQPHNMILDINMIAKSVGSKGKWTYTYRSMLDAGIPLMFSSDCPVCDPRPLAGIHALVTRQRDDGTPPEGWYPEQRLTVEEAVRGYTLTPAAALGVADEIGSIACGKRADLVVLDRNIYQVDPMEIPDTRVEMTVFDGDIVFEG
jgi:predicted amidohydrolase YtcJ